MRRWRLEVELFLLQKGMHPLQLLARLVACIPAALLLAALVLMFVEGGRKR